MDNKIFLFGDIYKEVELVEDEELKFGEIDKNKKKKMYKDVTAYEMSMNEYIDVAYVNNDSKMVTWDRYITHVLPEEKIKGKDISEFTREEIMGLMSSIYTTSVNVKKSVFSLLNSYIQWRISTKGEKINNPFSSINQDEVCGINGIALKNKLMSIEELDFICDEFAKHFDIRKFISLIFARYGIVGKNLCEMINLKFKHVHEDSMIVDIIDENGVVKEYPIDKTFIKWVNKAKIEVMEEMDNSCEIDDSYIIYKSQLRKGDVDCKIKCTTIYTYQKTVFYETKMKKIQFSMLKKSRMIELLLLNYRSKDILTTAELLDLMRMFTPDSLAGAWTTLKNDYEATTGDEVITLKTRGGAKKIIENNNPEASARKIYNDIFSQWDMPVIHKPINVKEEKAKKKLNEELLKV